MAVSCVCKNDENRINLPTLDRGLFDGTMKAAIQKDRKRNKNNTSGATGVHFDSKRGDYGWRRLCFNTKAISWADSNIKEKPSKLEKLVKINILESIGRNKSKYDTN